MKRPLLEIYKAADGWRWRLKAANGKTVCESGEAFKKRPSPVGVAEKMHVNFRDCDCLEA